ncbi:MAG: type II toxin-antitoxin system death-on-curing family toxin [Planctomycetota bacterium]
MGEPAWIEIDAVLIAHARQLAEHGGQAGIRDRGLLESALSRPRNAWAYVSPKPDAQALAAAYAFGLARNHPFLDGNKRIAAVVCETYLISQGVALTADDEAWYDAVIALSSGETTEEVFADWLRSHTAAVD